MNNLWNYLLGLVICFSISACGGGAQTTTQAPSAANPVPGMASGPISTFGSIVVNGVRYNTDSASFEVNDAPGTQADLSVGQIVTVKGMIDANGTTGTANAVTFDDTVKGPVQSIDLVGRQFVVLGQNVLVVAGTSFDDRFSPATMDGLSVGQIVEVSGQFDANNDIVATRIEPKPAGTQFEVHGTVSNLDNTNMRFNINNLVVDYSAALLDNFPAGQISNGDFVEAKGTMLGAAGELLATKVELDALLPGATGGDRIEIEGFITRFESAQDFDVAGQKVTSTSSTRFLGGSASDLGLNIKVEAEGDLDSDGVLVATKIDIRRAKAVRATANVDSVNAADKSLVVLGITVKVDAQTRLEDKTDADVTPLTLSDISAGDYIEVRGSEFPAGSGTILAARFEREDPDNRAILQGFVEAISEPSFNILGVSIETSGATVFREADGTVISSTNFFGQLTENSLVKAKGTEVANSTISATEVEFEIE